MNDIGAWRSELLDVSDFAQDDDPEDAEQRFDRFVELVDVVQGDEPDEVFLTLIKTLKDQQDYGAYESVFGALQRFDPARRGRLTGQGIVALLRRSPEHAGDVLSQIAFGEDTVVTAFNRSVSQAAAPAAVRELEQFVAEQEQPSGWLDHDAKRGRLRFDSALS